MNKTGIDWADLAATDGLEETLYFYTRNDYLIINNLLNGNVDFIWEVVAEMVIGDNIGVLKEHYAGERPPFDDRTIGWLKRRIWEQIDDAARADILKIAKNDIANILNAMKPTKNDIVLYRTARIGDGFRPNCSFVCCIGDVMDFKNISSTCVKPGWEENSGCEFYRYEITVPEGGLVLELDQFDCHNEDGEVLLSPMRCRVTNVRGSDNEKCKGVVELEYLERLSVHIGEQYYV